MRNTPESAPATTDAQWKQFERTAIAEMADWTPSLDMSGVSISDADRKAGSPKLGDKIARNPANHEDKWLVAADYFALNFRALAAAQQKPQPDNREKSVDRTREIATLEECDRKLEALQDYQRGACKVLPIRQLIDQRIRACRAEQKPQAAAIAADQSQPQPDKEADARRLDWLSLDHEAGNALRHHLPWLDSLRAALDSAMAAHTTDQAQQPEAEER